MTSDNFLFLSGPGSKIKIEGGNTSKFSEEFLAGIGAHAILKTGQIALAKFIAEHAHAHQVDKAGNNYISHPARVVENLISMPDFDAFSGDWQDFSGAAAWLHDVVEDTGENGFDIRTLVRTFRLA